MQLIYINPRIKDGEKKLFFFFFNVPALQYGNSITRMEIILHGRFQEGFKFSLKTTNMHKITLIALFFVFCQEIWYYNILIYSYNIYTCFQAFVLPIYEAYLSAVFTSIILMQYFTHLPAGCWITYKLQKVSLIRMLSMFFF